MKKSLLLLLLFVSAAVGQLRVEDMTEMTGPSATDVMYIVDDPDVTPAARKIELETIRDWIYTFFDSQIQDANVPYVYNVKAFGATINGTTDDTAAIQAAENAADDTNGTIFFPPGRYRVTATITFSSGTSVLFSSGAKIVIPTADEFADPVFKWTNATDFTIVGAQFEGGQTQATFAGAVGEDRAAIYLDTCSKFSISDVNITNKSIGVALKSSSKGSITNSRFVGFCDPDSYATGSGYNYSKAIWVGIDSGQSSDISISDCYFEHWGDAVGGSDSSARVTITGCQMDGFCDNAIYSSSGADWLVQGNYIKNSLGYGAKLRGSGHRVIGNKVYNSGSVALSLGGGGITITSLSLSQYDTGAVIADNLVQTTTSNGIIICRNTASDYGLKGFTITGNDCNDTGNSAVVDNYGMGIQIGIGVHEGVVANNVLRNTGESSLHGAMALLGSEDLDCNDVIVIGNTFINCTGGIYAQYTAGITCTNNHFREIVAQAIRLYQDCDNWTIAFNDGNNVDAVGTVLIYADSGELTGSKLIGNSATGNFTTITNLAADTGTGNFILANDTDDLTTLGGSLRITSGGVIEDVNNVTVDCVDFDTHGINVVSSNGGAIAATLADGSYVGQTVTFVCKVAGNNIDVTVAHHVTSDPEVIRLDAAKDGFTLVWDGSDWVETWTNSTAYP